jgi:hypothetical protein
MLATVVDADIGVQIIGSAPEVSVSLLVERRYALVAALILQ